MKPRVAKGRVDWIILTRTALVADPTYQKMKDVLQDRLILKFKV